MRDGDLGHFLFQKQDDRGKRKEEMNEDKAVFSCQKGK